MNRPAIGITVRMDAAELIQLRDTHTAILAALTQFGEVLDAVLDRNLAGRPAVPADELAARRALRAGGDR